MDTEEYLEELGCENVVYFKDHDYKTAIVGIAMDNRLIYDYDKMIECLVAEDGFSVEEAADWIDYNTYHSLSCLGGNTPIIMYPFD